MTVFYTDVLNGSGFAQDEEGQDFPDLNAARRAALKSAGDILSEEMTAGRYKVDLEFFIRDEAGARLATLPLTARVTGLD